MLELQYPAFLVAGAAAAAVPLLLHLIARRPPQRMPLPTRRFLRADRRSTVRLRRRPTDLLLLALRMMLLALLGAALAQPRWVPAAGGLGQIVLLDRSAGASSAWAEAVAHSRELLLSGGASSGALVLFDTAATVVPVGRIGTEFFDSLVVAGASDAPVDYAAALRALPLARRAAGAVDSLRVTLASPLRWEGWRDGLAPLRRAAWPAELAVVDLRADAAGAGDLPDRGRAYVVGGGDGARYVEAALGALGWEAHEAPAVGPLPRDGEVYVLVGDAAPAALREVVPGGATLIAAAGLLADDFEIAAARDIPHREVGAGESVFASDAGPAGGQQARLVAVRRDGTPAARALAVGDGCAVALGFSLEAEALVGWDGYPRLLERLIHGCDARIGRHPPVGSAVPLDAGARAVLAGTSLSSRVAASTSDRGDARPFGRWLLLAVLLVAGVETALAYRGGRAA